MTKKIKVIVVDDSAFMRIFISDMINKQPDMEVIDTAHNGEIAIEKIKKHQPDVVTLDIEMPNKNGLEVLKQIDKDKTQVIMISALTAKGSIETIEALRLGAFDFIQKPAGSNFKIAEIEKELVEKIRYAVARKSKTDRVSKRVSSSEPEQRHIKKPSTNIKAVVMGASTGGPRVLYDIITKLPKDLGVPVFVVQHMPAGFTKAFAQRLNSNSQLEVEEAKNGEKIKPGKVYIAPGGYHMTIDQDQIRLDTTPAIHGVRPAADKLFISAARVFTDGLLGCVLTGMGKDGAEGVRAINKNGGFVIAQDEETSVIYGMPKAAYETGCVDIVLPDNKISEAVVRLVKKGKL